MPGHYFQHLRVAPAADRRLCLSATGAGAPAHGFLLHATRKIRVVKSGLGIMLVKE